MLSNLWGGEFGLLLTVTKLGLDNVLTVAIVKRDSLPLCSENFTKSDKESLIALISSPSTF